jgi:hypothetical protein
VLFQLFFPGLAHVSLLERESGFEIVTQLATPENDRAHIHGLWIGLRVDGLFLNFKISQKQTQFSRMRKRLPLSKTLRWGQLIFLLF